MGKGYYGRQLRTSITDKYAQMWRETRIIPAWHENGSIQAPSMHLLQRRGGTHSHPAHGAGGRRFKKGKCKIEIDRSQPTGFFWHGRPVHSGSISGARSKFLQARLAYRASRPLPIRWVCVLYLERWVGVMYMVRNYTGNTAHRVLLYLVLHMVSTVPGITNYYKEIRNSRHQRRTSHTVYRKRSRI